MQRLLVVVVVLVVTAVATAVAENKAKRTAKLMEIFRDRKNFDFRDDDVQQILSEIDRETDASPPKETVLDLAINVHESEGGEEMLSSKTNRGLWCRLTKKTPLSFSSSSFSSQNSPTKKKDNRLRRGQDTLLPMTTRFRCQERFQVRFQSGCTVRIPERSRGKRREHFYR